MHQTITALTVSAILSTCLFSAGIGTSPLPLQTPEIPSPKSVLGFEVGADFKLASYEESIRYFRLLDASSDKLRLIQAGRTSQGRPWYMALISTPENLAGIERFRDISVQLAHPDGVSEEEARRLSLEGKAFVDINGGLHSTEAAGAQHTIQLAYQLLSESEEAPVREILDNVIVMLWPSLNPDGQEIVVNWYRSNLGTPYEVAPLVELYQKYVGHDNNRDAYMLNMVESRVLTRSWQFWEPQIIYVHHQTAPFPTRIWLPPFADPIASRTPPLMARQVNTIGMAIAEGLESRGLLGAIHMGTGFDAWYPGYIDFLPMLQNRVAFWTETALYRYATPRFYTVSDFPEEARDLVPGTLYPSPWKGGWWRLRDAVDYMRVASLSVLEYAAKYKDRLLFNRYQSGSTTILKYKVEPPFAYFIPREQRDPVAAVEMLKRLAFNGIRVFELSSPISVEGLAHPAGSWIIPMDQEFGELVRELFQEQKYPDLKAYPQGPPEKTFDASGWTLPYLMDVRIIPVMSPLTAQVRSALKPVRGEALAWEKTYSEASDVDLSSFDSVSGAGFDTHPVAAGIQPSAGQLRGSGKHIVLDPSHNNAFRALNQALAQGAEVHYAPPAGDAELSSSGRYVVAGISTEMQSGWAASLALDIDRRHDSAGPRVKSRVGLYRPWRASMDEGWTRWLFEQYEFDFANLRNVDFYRDSLDQFDVIVLPDETSQSILEGFRPGTVPPRYQGGIGQSGVRNLESFVRKGGTLICLNRSSDFAISALHLPVANVVADLSQDEFYSSGSIVEVTVNPGHPVMAGMPSRAKVFFDRSPVFTTLAEFQGVALASYRADDSSLLSGYLQGEKHVRGFAAALDVYLGKGHVLLIGFRPQWRGQPFGTFRILFNAAFYSGELAAGAYSASDFWEPPAPPTGKKDHQPDEKTPDSGH